MKVALLVVCQPRYYELGFPFINNCLIKPFNPDVFIHCWFDQNYIGRPYSASPWNAGHSDVMKPNTIQEMLHLYKPKSFTFEPEKFWDNNLQRSYEQNKGRQYSYITFSQAYSQWYANELKCQYERINNFKYDWVVKIRTDWKIQTLLPLSMMNKDKLYVPDNCRNPKFINDQFAVGSSDNMNVYTSLFPHIDNYFVFDNIQLVGETMITHHLQVNKVPYKPIPISHEIIRG